MESSPVDTLEKYSKNTLYLWTSVDCAWIVGQYIDTLEKHSKNTLYLWISVDCPWIVGQYTP